MSMMLCTFNSCVAWRVALISGMGYLHPEMAEIKVVIDRLNQQKQGMSQQPQKQPQLQES
jgi:hypothetical protein